MTFFEIEQCPVELTTDRGVIRVHDGIAAGSLWVLVEFLQGHLVGTKIWMNADETDATYFPHQSDDGYLFNSDGSAAEEDYDIVHGGEYREDLTGLTINLV